MFNSTIRVASRRVLSSRTLVNSSGRRFLSTAPPSQKSRSWKSGAARWALAAGGIYYYNTSNIFAEEPEAAIRKLDESMHNIQGSNQPTIDAIVEEKRQREAQQIEEERRREKASEAKLAAKEGDGEENEGGEGGIMGDLEGEADQQGAFNPETGEINWDCPCLGGMAHGPCGEEFRAAFSCFIYSTEEPKGVECIEKFQGMQDCFRAHPEEYGAELQDDEDEIEEELRAREELKARDAAFGDDAPSSESKPESETPKAAPAATEEKEAPELRSDSLKTKAVEAQKVRDEGSDLLPKAAHDATAK